MANALDRSERGAGASRASRWVRERVGQVVGVVARLWLASLRVIVDADPALDPAMACAWVLAFFHGTQFPLLAWRRRRRTVVLVSLSLDGAMQARALERLGMFVVRGSTSRGGLRGLTKIVHELRTGAADAAFAVDGPRGPYGRVQGGARIAARATSAALVPMGAAVAGGTVLLRAWDRFVIAWPFSRVVICLGAPLDAKGPPSAVDEALAIGIVAANARARQILDARPSRSSPLRSGVTGASK